MPGAQANKIALERIYARASENQGLVKARKNSWESWQHDTNHK